MDTPIPKLLTVSQLAAHLGITVRAVYARLAKNEIPGRVNLGPRTVRFREDKIAEWIAESAVAPNVAAEAG